MTKAALDFVRDVQHPSATALTKAAEASAFAADTRNAVKDTLADLDAATHILRGHDATEVCGPVSKQALSIRAKADVLSRANPALDVEPTDLLDELEAVSALLADDLKAADRKQKHLTIARKRLATQAIAAGIDFGEISGVGVTTEFPQLSVEQAAAGSHFKHVDEIAVGEIRSASDAHAALLLWHCAKRVRQEKQADRARQATHAKMQGEYEAQDLAAFKQGLKT